MTNARRAGAVSVAIPSALIAVLVAVHFLAPGWSRQLVWDMWDLTASLSEYRQSVADGRVIEAEAELAHRRIEVSGHIVARLIDGRISLAEAADELLPLLENVPGFTAIWELYFRAPSPWHGAACYAIDRAGRMLLDDPARREEVLCRLEAEYAELHLSGPASVERERGTLAPGP